ncbi:hypothetical protein ACLX1H_010190, partial [Fusarium chlamydosporum]
IYSLRGLVEPDVAESIEVDYTKPAKEIFTLACRDEITRAHDLEFMTHSNAATTPSWVADLKRPWGFIRLDSNARGKSAPAVDLIEPHMLEVAGIACDEPCILPGKTLVETPDTYRQRIIEAILALITVESLQDDAVLDKLTMMLTYGAVRDYNKEKIDPPTLFSLHSLQDWRKKIRQWMKGTFENEAEDGQDSWETDNAYIRC